MEFAISLESRGYAKSTEEIYNETLLSEREALDFLRAQGLPVASVTIEAPAEFPKGAKKFVAQVLITFSVAFAGEAGKDAAHDAEKAAATAIQQFFDQKFHHNAEVDVKPVPPSAPSGSE